MHSMKTLEPLDSFSNGDLRHTPENEFVSDDTLPCSEIFLFDQYDWLDPEWVALTRRGSHAWRPLRLWQQPLGAKRFARATEPSPYFTAVSPVDFQSIRVRRYENGDERRFTAKIDYDPNEPDRIANIYARCAGRGEEPQNVLLHRLIIDCVFDSKAIGDHITGHGLDNRRCNLILTNSSANVHNALRIRREDSKEYGLPAGVERRSDGFGGKVCKRRMRGKRGKDGKRPVVTIRSPDIFATPDEAHAWYLAKLAEFNGGREKWAHGGGKPPRLILPPRLDQEPSVRSMKLRSVERTGESPAEVPF